MKPMPRPLRSVSRPGEARSVARSDQFEHFVDAVRTYFHDLFGDGAAIDEHLIDAAGSQYVFTIRVSGGCGNKGTVILADCRSSQPNGGCAPADQETLAFFEAQRFEQRAPRRLQHLGDGSEGLQGSSVSRVCTCFVGTQVNSA